MYPSAIIEFDSITVAVVIGSPPTNVTVGAVTYPDPGLVTVICVITPDKFFTAVP